MKSKTRNSSRWFTGICLGILLLVLASIAYRLSLIFTTDWRALLAGMGIADWILTAAVLLLAMVLGFCRPAGASGRDV